MAHVLAKVAVVQGVGSRGTMAASGDGWEAEVDVCALWW
jgi:hypothetical protein